MRFFVPAGNPRLLTAAAGALLFLGWLSGLSPSTYGQVRAAASHPAPDDTSRTRRSGARPAGPMSGPGARVSTRQAAANLRFARPFPAMNGPDGKTAPRVDCRKVKCITLTFDDGPGPYTDNLLRILAAHHARVTFFLIGGNIRGREATVRKEIAAGHAIGDHTWSHPQLSTMAAGQIRSQLVRTLRAIHGATGGTTGLMRPPYGATNHRVAAVTRELHLAQILWSVDTDDWLDRNSNIVAHRAVSWAHRDDIILMHDIHPTTVKAVPRILDGLSKRGFTFVTVPELFAPHPLKPGKAYFGGN
jgi:peptidoglycan/xylan/chitin deacetylase (PgdA/CDA1 family)